MPSKHGIGLCVAFLIAFGASGADADRYLGAASCSSSGCHGGAGERNQYIIWFRHDVHTRAPATLTMARSARIAEALKIGNPETSSHCTVCHAPFHPVPESRRDRAADPAHGVSCENCHGPASAWIVSHTRPDFDHATRVGLGMRDLKSPYARANACVACHQNVDPALLKAGHPELIFELDGQSISEPKHWKDPAGSAPALWLAGQAVALREISWALAGQTSPADREVNRWKALVWLLKSSQSTGADPWSDTPSADNFKSVQQTADSIARAASAHAWTPAETTALLKKLSTVSVSESNSGSSELSARRAERLVLALDRLLAATPRTPQHEAASQALSELFKLAQSIPDFDPSRFQSALQKFSGLVSQL